MRALSWLVGAIVLVAPAASACNSLLGLQDPANLDASTEADSGGREALAEAGKDGPSDTSTDDTPQAEGAAEATTYPAQHPPLPTIELVPGGVVPSYPSIVPILFPGYAYASDVSSLVASLTLAGYWKETVLEYGVTAVGAGVPITVTESAPASIDKAGIEQWLAGKFTSNAPGFGTPSSSTIYTIFYPQSTTVMPGSCSYGTFGYHYEVSVGGVAVPYAVVLDCGNEDSVTSAATHHWINAMTDLFPLTQPAYADVSNSNVAWALTSVWGIGVGSWCFDDTPSTVLLPLPSTHSVFLAWSNHAASLSHEPCNPQPAGIYFNAGPVVRDMILFYPPGGGTPTMASGIQVAHGASKTIDVDLFSDVPTSSDWLVDAVEMPGTSGPDLQLSLDRSHGHNGDVLRLTITVSSSAGSLNQMLFVESTLGSVTRRWPVLVGN